MCQQFVGNALQVIREKHPDVYILHYMDDILLSASSVSRLEDVFPFLTAQLTKYGLVIANEKIQKGLDIEYLGSRISPGFIKPQKIQIRRDKLQTLNDFQKVLGDINWLRSYLSITTGQLMPLFQILEGDTDLNSPRQLTPTAEETLKLVEKAINNAMLARYDPEVEVFTLSLPTHPIPTAVIIQNDKALLWIHSKAHNGQALPQYPLLLAKNIKNAVKATLQGVGKFPDKILLPYPRELVDEWIEVYPQWTSFLQYPIEIKTAYSLSSQWKLFVQHCIVPSVVRSQPVDGSNVFTDGNPTSAAIYHPPQVLQVIKTPFSSTQQNELTAVLLALWNFHDPINIIVDSQYVAQAIP